MAANINSQIDPRDYDPADWVLHGHEKGRGHLNVFQLRDSLIHDYASFVSSFINIRDSKIREYVEGEFASGTLWPQPLVDTPPGPPADEHGNFLPLPEWNPGHPKPPNWPPHIHPPKEVAEYAG